MIGMPCGRLLSSAAMTSAVNTPRLMAIQETACSSGCCEITISKHRPPDEAHDAEDERRGKAPRALPGANPLAEASRPLLRKQLGAELRVPNREVIVAAHLRRVPAAVLDEGVPAARMLIPVEALAEPAVALRVRLHAGGERGDQRCKHESPH